MEVPAELHQHLRQHDQQHVLAWWPALGDEQRRQLLGQLQALDLEQLQELYRLRGKTWPVPPLEKLCPIEAANLGPDNRQQRQRGEEVLRRGEVAALVVAGGQGTRLGADQPKGLFPVGPVSGKSLFQFHAEKVLALRRKYQARLPFLVMTSQATDEKTRTFFSEQNYFGLSPDEVHFFCQGTMPALDIDTGRLLLAGPGRLALGPNGHGGVLPALQESGLMDRLEQWGIRHIFYFQVDNPLTRIAEPTFIGLHLEREAEVSIKAVEKGTPGERVGNLAEIDGRCHIIEYSDLPASLAQAEDENGQLRFRLGSTAIHLFSVDFLKKVLRNSSALPFHLARKKVAYLNEAGEMLEPNEPNALKFEKFIFDILPLAERYAVVLTTREREFSPLKNDTGPDSPETVRQALCRQAARWLQRAGVIISSGNRKDLPPLEISPLFALDSEELKAKIKPGFKIDGPVYLQ